MQLLLAPGRRLTARAEVRRASGQANPDNWRRAPPAGLLLSAVYPGLFLIVAVDATAVGVISHRGATQLNGRAQYFANRRYQSLQLRPLESLYAAQGTDASEEE